MRYVAILLAAVLTAGCYHYSFEQQPVPPPGTPLVTYHERVPTFFNGFLGEGKVDTMRYCAHPVKTELHVAAADVALSIVTLFIYTPHTLTVVCPAPGYTYPEASRAPQRR